MIAAFTASKISLAVVKMLIHPTPGAPVPLTSNKSDRAVRAIFGAVR